MLDVCSYPDSDRITNVPGCRFGQHRTYAVLCLFARAAGTLTQAQPSAAKAADPAKSAIDCRHQNLPTKSCRPTAKLRRQTNVANGAYSRAPPRPAHTAASAHAAATSASLADASATPATAAAPHRQLPQVARCCRSR